MNLDNIKRAIRLQFPPERPTDAGPALNSRPYEASPQLLPVVTLLFILTSVALYYLTNFQGDVANNYNKLGHKSNWQILFESPWAVVTNAFFHAPFNGGGILHIGMNCLAMLVLGSQLERSLGSVKTLILFLAFAFVSGGYQLMVTEGINFLSAHYRSTPLTPNYSSLGLSGILYAIIGFMWGAWKRWTGLLEKFSNSLLKQALFWQLICFILTYTGTMPIGNTSHLSGLIFGFMLGMWSCYGIPHAKVWFAASMVMLVSVPLALYFGHQYITFIFRQLGWL